LLTCPTFILATTNYPENFLENIIDRPERFDIVQEIKCPGLEDKINYLEFLLGEKTIDTNQELKNILRKAELSYAHLKECVLQLKLKNIPLEQSIKKLLDHKE